MQRSVILHFPRTLTDRPIISHLVRDYDVEVNILQAYIMPDEGGHLFAILQGEEKSLERALGFLKGLGVRTILPTRNLVWDDQTCVHCGACVGHCRTGALAFDPETLRVVYDPERCLGCGLCIPACGFGAIESIGQHLLRKGEL